MTVQVTNLSIPPSFTKSAEKLGWLTLNYRISPTSVHLVQDDYRLTFIREEPDEKMWILDRYCSSRGWHLVHKMRHPGTTRLDWVLKTSHQIMASLSLSSDQLPPKPEPKARPTKAKTTKKPATRSRKKT